MKSSRKSVFNALRPWAMILAANAVVAFLVAAFVSPHGIIMAGTTGIALALNRFFSIDTALAVLILNVLMLLLGLIVLGKKFFLTTVASSLVFPIFLAAMQCIPGIGALTTNPLLASLFTGGLLGAALGVIVRLGTSTGGTDVINLVMNKWLHWPLSVCVWATDIVVLGVQALFSDTEQILYGIITLVIESLVLNQVMLLGQSQIQLLVISRQFEELRAKLLTELQAGVTLLLIETGCAGWQGKGILCVIPPRKLFAAKELIDSIDPEAFLTITQVREVRGQGFSYERYIDAERLQRWRSGSFSAKEM
ncbi:MAG: YitT family protein [Clostridiales bacterium]|nr:YitT family protein [Clostridiales bacterium]